MSEEDHCYCVLLNADGGAAFPSLEVPEFDDDSESRKLKRSKASFLVFLIQHSFIYDVAIK